MTHPNRAQVSEVVVSKIKALLMQGASNSQIAKDCGVGRRTVNAVKRDAVLDAGR